MPQDLGYSQLPVSPVPDQPQGLGGGEQERQMQMVLQLMAQKASDPTKRRQMAEQLASQLPPPPDNIFGRGMSVGGAPGLPKQQEPQIPDISGLGSLIPPQQQQLVQPGAPSSPAFVGPPSPFIPGNPGFVGPMQPGMPGTPEFIGPQLPGR